MRAHSFSQRHSGRVGRLYDKLFSFEVKKASAAYPIHKKLTFPEADVVDIYQWLIRHLPLNNVAHILDAGCGVGFGCQELVKHTDSTVTGISLSEEEISQAKKFARQENSKAIETGLLLFQTQSFEELPANYYDCIIMVESLKHCSDLSRALKSVANALTENGVCYVVEDIYIKKLTPSILEAKLSQQLCDDWHLRRLYDLNDLQHVSGQYDLSAKLHSDLSDYMQLPSYAMTCAKLSLFSLFSRFSNASVVPIYRGGFILDWLYMQGKMRYQVVTLAKTSVTRRNSLTNITYDETVK